MSKKISSYFERKPEKDLRAKRLNFRVDSSESIGSGHVSRVTPIAFEAIERGMTVRVISRELSHESRALLTDMEVPWQILPRAELNSDLPDNDRAAQSQLMRIDAIQTRGFAEEHFQEFIIADHYGLNDYWFSEVQKSYKSAAAIVDGYGPSLSIEMKFELTIWNLRSGISLQELGAASSQLKKYSGNPYFLFSPEMKIIHPKTRAPITVGGALKVVVFLGLSHSLVSTTSVLEALLGLQPTIDLEITLVAPSQVAKEILGNFAPRGTTLEVVHSTNSREFFEICLAADFVVGSPGVSSVERTKLGIPQVLFSIADNQKTLGNQLEELGVATYAGDLRDLEVFEMEQKIKSFIEGPLIFFDSNLGPQMFDFFGPGRILQTLCPTDNPSYSIRGAIPSDGPTLFVWANDSLRRQNSREESIVLPRVHVDWIKEVLAEDSQSSIYIFLCNEQPAGQVQFHPTEVENEFEIGYSLDIAYRGQGLSRTLIRMAIFKHLKRANVSRYIATVKATNEASLKVLKSVGFSRDENSVDGFVQLIMKFPDARYFDGTRSGPVIPLETLRPPKAQ
jgi:UDP-2,4-diacetamido-2,4,6-trideoxy-beta-L-altropyranose hydrolase